ncbi:MAG: DUF4838 domain-containing protein, partial [Lentisphaeria bacterium]|nr:DUF4838 domain-containing protein [Lentisphaeria bacterium]
MMKKILLLCILSIPSILFAVQVDFTDAAILLPEGNNRNMEKAATLLKSCMDRLSGGKTRILKGNAGSGKKICLHLAAPDAKYGKRFWQIKQEGDSLHITGRSPSSLIFGVADFLARSGFYALTWDCDALPESGRLLAEKDLEVTASPAFGKGQIIDGMKGGRLNKNAAAGLLRYHQLNYLKSRPEDDDTIYNSYGARNVVHNLYQIVPPAKYAKTHPEYYSMNSQGVRSWKDTDHLCFSNQEVRRVAAENLIREIASHRKKGKEYHPVYYSISQNDCGRTFCHCKNCQALVKHYGGETGLLLDFVNEVAREVAKVYPDVKISTEAYVNSEKPLKTIKPASNVIIRYCDVYSRSDFRIPLEKQPERLHVLKEWAEMCPGLAIWDYLNFAKSRSPETAIDPMISDLRLFRKLGVGNILLEYEYQFDRVQNFIGLQQFLAAQLLKDPGQDAENLIRIYMKSYYGKT